MKMACAYLFDEWYTGWLYRVEQRLDLRSLSKSNIWHIIDSFDFSDDEVTDGCVKAFSCLRDAKIFADRENEIIRKIEENETE